MTGCRLLLFTLGLAASGCQSSSTSRPGQSPVVEVGAAPTTHGTASPPSRQCRIETTYGEVSTKARTSTDVFLVERGDVPAELRLVSADSSIVVQREYDAMKRLVSESYRSKDKDGERHFTTVWHRGRDQRVESADLVVEERSAERPSKQTKQIVRFPERDASGHWLRKEGRNEGAPVTRTDVREYDAAGRLATETTRWSATTERPAKSAESRFTYEGSSRTPAHEESTTTDAAGQVTERLFRRFDASGRMRTELRRPSTGSETTREAKYDDAGHIVEELSSVDVAHRSSYQGDCPPDLHKLFAVTSADAGED
jgi:YD repeat-containing protein